MPLASVLPQSRLALIALLFTAPSFAAPPPPDVAKPEACTAIEGDADRLACYDAALGRKLADPGAADADAVQAKAAKESIAQDERVERDALPPGQRAQRVVGDLFRAEDSPSTLDERIANAGKGGLLDSRWELAKDSKLGTFNFRAYKPVYLLPAF